MVVGAAQPQSQPQPPQPELTAEEEALKRNTDCVYFLASPVSCKKGSECEYRHSEHALYNPRDCFFWLNGNCLNLKCSFRHPPLDGLLGSPAANSAGPSLPILQTVTTPATHAPGNSSKQAVPCIFFQKGFCLKADKCPFSHGTNPMINGKVPQAPVTAAHGTEPASLKKVFGGLQKCTQEVKIPQVGAPKIVGGASQAKPAPKVEVAPPRNGVGIQRNVPPTRGLDDDALRHKPRSVLPAMNGDYMGQPNHLMQARVSENHGFQNGKDVDEHMRESSPGFDVLVDDELGDSDYYHGEDQFGRTRGHEGRNLNAVNDYDLDRPTDFNHLGDVDREGFRDSRGYDPYDHTQGRYGWEQHRASSERLVVNPAHLERRGYRKSDSPDRIDGSDLRHRLSKHRRVNGPRSIINNDYDDHVEERKHRPRRDSQQLPSHEGSLSSRLRGRIKLPGASSPVNDSDLRHEREVGRGRSRERSRDRLSPRRAPLMSQQGRLRDRIQGRVQEDYNNEGRNFGAPRMRRDVMDDRITEFSRPKRLSELRGGMDAENRVHPYPGKPNMSIENSQQPEGDLSFDGPMPLSEILKRKREAKSDSGSRKRSSIKEQSNSEKDNTVSNQAGSETGDVTEMHNNQSSVAKEETKSAITNTVATESEKVDVAPLQTSEGQNDDELETEDGMIYDETLEDHELEGEDQREGEYDYEQGEDGEYYEEGENVDGEEEYLEEEEGDDFAKKIGVMFS